MAVLFSVVTATDGKETVEFLTGGIPKDYGDLERWKAFDNFIGNMSEESNITVKTKSYLYGEGERYAATPEEIAYFMQRIGRNADFVSSRCTPAESGEFSFAWSPKELYGMEMN